MEKKKPYPLDVTIGSHLRLRRKMMGMSQDLLAKRMGITFQQIQKYERGTNSVSARRLFELAQVLEVSPLYFYALPESDDYQPTVDRLTTQAIHLVQDFTLISSPEVRNSIAAFVREIAKGGQHGV
ncbi:MAG: helix-turn-helix transcriptional regulator [Alphaproteobacteria bacterium]|nr:helix-turn-helix transcriptional regulator [Alphaproteobacteria bacterium]